MKISALSILILLVLAAILINTATVQNFLVKRVTHYLAGELGTTISIDRVNFTLFNKVNLEGLYVQEKNTEDTLLYTGRLTVSITDWFFLKDDVTIRYFAMEDANIHVRRHDSIWNYQFIVDYFSKPTGNKKEKKPLQFSLRDIELKNIRLKESDEWRGQDKELVFKALKITPEIADFSKKEIHLTSIIIEEPYFRIYDYPALRPKRPPSVTNDSIRFNPDNWLVKVDEINIENGFLKADKKISRPVYSYFDDARVHFGKLNATLSDVALVGDTLFSNINMSAQERSGFTIQQLTSKFRMEPGAMIFDSLLIKTPYSLLSNYFAMRYADFNKDMPQFIERVKMEGNFNKSKLHSRDIAYFAPELNTWNRLITMDGRVNGSVDNLSSNNFVIETGQNSYLNGSISIKGLPNIEQTLIDFNASAFRTSYSDLAEVFPALTKVADPNLAAISYLQFKGNFKGYLRNFATHGTINTNLGTIDSDIHMSIPAKTNITQYSGKITTQSFDLGKFIKVDKVGKISFSGTVNGQGLSAQTINANLNGHISQAEFNGYNYSDIMLSGDMEKKLFSGNIKVNDPNFIATLDGNIDLNPHEPEYNFFADLQRSNMDVLGFVNVPLQVIGKFDMNFSGNDIDDFVGYVSLYDVAVTKDYQTFVFDTLNLSAQKIGTQKILQLRNTEANAFLMGEYNILDLPNTVKKFLNKYYPAYIPPPIAEVNNQNFLFQLDVKNIDQYLALLNPSLQGFNNSTVVGSLNSETNLVAISAMIPYAAYKNLAVHDFNLTGQGNMNELQMMSTLGNTVVNDSLQFPGSRITLNSSNNISQLTINTSATQTIGDAKLSTQITTLHDGVKIHFDPSSIVVNDKTWKIDDGGELLISRSQIDADAVHFHNGEQQITILSKHSDIGNWNDIVVRLTKLNIGDFMPYILKEPALEGVITGDIVIEDIFRNLYVSTNLQADQFSMGKEQIGSVAINGAWDNSNRNATYEAISNNPHYKFSIAGSYNAADSLQHDINAVGNFEETSIAFLEQYLGSIFTNIKGSATGHLKMSGDIKNPDITGEVDIRNGYLNVLYTQCIYRFDSTKIAFTPGKIEFRNVIIYDTLNDAKNRNNFATVSGSIAHTMFDHFDYNVNIATNRLLVLNTTRTDNELFYGKVVGKANFRLRGPDNDMRMTISGSPVDSSNIYLTSASSKESNEAEYIIWKQYGREMNIDSLGRLSSQMNVDLDLTANSFTKMYMILDEVTGDIIEATGNGNLKMSVGSNAPFTINGRYNVERGFYRFSFQEIFKKPFILLPNEGSYIRWDGDPNLAEVYLKAKYQATDVKLSSLYAEQGQTTDPEMSRLRGERTDVDVLCTLQGSLNKPDIHFDIALAPNSDVKNSQRLLGDLQRINTNDNEKNKQVAYLIVFRSFAPIGQYNVLQADATTFAFNTISEYISGYLSSSLKTLLHNVFKDPNLSVNFNYTRASIDPTGTGNTNNTVNLTRDNVSLQFIKSLLNDKLVLSFGSDFNFVSSGGSQSAFTSQSTNFLFLPDITAELKITPDGKFRVSFFYRSHFDALSTNGRRSRAGGSFSFRTEFDSERLRRQMEKSRQRREDEDETSDDSTVVRLW